MSTRLRWAALTLGLAMAVAPTAALAQSDDPARRVRS